MSKSKKTERKPETMNEPIMFTPQDIINAILAVCGAISVVAGATAVIVKCVTAMRKPNKTQDERLDALEADVKDVKERIDAECERITDRFHDDGSHIDKIEEANVVTQRALLALLSHSINGNDIESLKRAKTDLENYLTSNS